MTCGADTVKGGARSAQLALVEPSSTGRETNLLQDEWKLALFSCQTVNIITNRT